MTRLLWKELHEKRVWMVALCMASVAPLLFGWGYFFRGEINTYGNWTLLVVVTTILMGASGNSSELSGRSDFLLSRPIGWKRVVLAKIVCGFVVLFMAALLSAGTYVMVCQEQYRYLLTLASVMAGIGNALLVTGIAFLFGLCCSVVVPGVAGGALVTILVIVGAHTARNTLQCS